MCKSSQRDDKWVAQAGMLHDATEETRLSVGSAPLITPSSRLVAADEALAVPTNVVSSHCTIDRARR